MKDYAIYWHPDQGNEAVKVGFSFPAFILNFLWAFYQKIWGYALGMLAVSLFLIPCARIFYLEGDFKGASLMIIFEFYFLFLFGEKGSEWKKENLISRSFKFQKKVQANSVEAALSNISKQK